MARGLKFYRRFYRTELQSCNNLTMPTSGVIERCKINKRRTNLLKVPYFWDLKGLGGYPERIRTSVS